MLLRNSFLKVEIETFIEFNQVENIKYAFLKMYWQQFL